MLGEQATKKEQAYLKKTLAKLKGHAVPLFGYHILREHILKEIAGEYQGSILYWAGKNLSDELPVSSYEECVDLFSELGWGQLAITETEKYKKVFHLESPFFLDRHVDTNQTTFALECGFLAEVVAKLEQQITQGEFSATQQKDFLSVQFIIYGQDREHVANPEK